MLPAWLPISALNLGVSFQTLAPYSFVTLMIFIPEPTQARVSSIILAFQG